MRSVVPIIPDEIRELLPFGYQVASGSRDNPFWPTYDDILKTLSSPPTVSPLSLYQHSETSVRIVSEEPDRTASGLLAFIDTNRRGRPRLEQIGSFRWETKAIVRDIASPNGDIWYYGEATAADGTTLRLTNHTIERVQIVRCENTYINRQKIKRRGIILQETPAFLVVETVDVLFELPETNPERFRRAFELLTLFPIGDWRLLTDAEKERRRRAIAERKKRWRQS